MQWTAWPQFIRTAPTNAVMPMRSLEKGRQDQAMLGQTTFLLTLVV